MESDGTSFSEKVSLTLPRITSLLGFLGALATAMETGVDQRKGPKSVLGRTHFIFQLPLLVINVCGMIGRSAAPQSSSLWGAWGNTATCEVQGFLTQFCFAILVPLDMFVSVCYLLMVRYNWSEMQLCKIERPLHVFVWSLGLASALFPLFMDLYNPSWEHCWIAQYPPLCETDPEDVPCERGSSKGAANIIVIVYVLSALSTAVCCMLSIYLYVRRQEQLANLYRFSRASLSFSAGNDNNDVSEAHDPSETSSMRRRFSRTSAANVNRNRSRSTGIQGILYCSATLVSCLPVFIAGLLSTLGTRNLLVITLGGTMVPLLGFFHMLVIFRTRSNMQTAYGRFVKRIITCCYCCGDGPTTAGQVEHNANVTSSG